MAESLTLHGEILVPYPLMQNRQAADVEQLLHDAGLLPVGVQDRRWRLAAERSGYVLTYTFALVLTP